MDRSSQQISLGKQEYIETIHELCGGSLSQATGTKAIADRLGVKMPSVTQALRRLAEAALVNYSPRSAVTLTLSGIRLAEELKARHEILEEFFNRIGCSPEKASKIACLVEHDIDMDIASKIKIISSHLETCESFATTLKDIEKDEPSSID